MFHVTSVALILVHIHLQMFWNNKFRIKF
jgi:hypothetical protein